MGFNIFHKKGYMCLYFQMHMSKIIVKGATQVIGHSLKLQFCMFERSQGKHNSVDCH
jgi:hypothetical protein